MKLTLISASTIDGITARGPKDPIDWTSKEDKKFFAKVTKEAGVILMGRNTHEAIGRILPERLNIVFTSKARDYQGAPGQLEFTDKSPKEVLADLEKRGYHHGMLIGGPTLNRAFLEEGLIDEVILSVAPKVFGEGMNLFSGGPPATLSRSDGGRGSFDIGAELLGVERLGEDGIVARYKIKQ